MVGLPAIALAMLAIDLATLNRGKNPSPSFVGRHLFRRRPAYETFCHDHPARGNGGFLVYGEAG